MRKLLTHLPSYAALLLGVSLSMFNYAQADTLTLTESQKDAVKCLSSKDPDTHQTVYECYQNPKGSYSATAKLSAATFAENGISLDQLDENTELGIEIGLFAFSGSISTAKKNTGKVTATSLKGTWTEDGTVRITANSKGATISISGKWDSEGNGQQIYTSACEANGTGPTTEEASITIGDKIITWPVDITCTVKTSSKKAKDGDSYELTNMNIKAKLAP